MMAEKWNGIIIRSRQLAYIGRQFIENHNREAIVQKKLLREIRTLNNPVANVAPHNSSYMM